MKTVIFAHRTVGYNCVKHLIEMAKPILVIIPNSDNGIDDYYKSVKKLVSEKEIQYYQPKHLKNNTHILNSIEQFNPEIAFSCYYPHIIPDNILSVFKFGGLNIHGGVLPYYRGTFSGVWSIINDEIESGVSLHYMEKNIDLGDIVEVQKCQISNDETGLSLYEKTSEISLNIFKKYYCKLEKGDILPRIVQSSKIGTYYSRKLPFDGLIQWSWNDRKVYNFCRALNFPPYKGAVTYLNGNEFEIIEAVQTDSISINQPGTIISVNKGILVSTSTNDIYIITIKCLGKTLNNDLYSDFGIFEGGKFES